MVRIRVDVIVIKSTVPETCHDYMTVEIGAFMRDHLHAPSIEVRREVNSLHKAVGRVQAKDTTSKECALARQKLYRSTSEAAPQLFFIAPVYFKPFGSASGLGAAFGLGAAAPPSALQP